MTPFEHLKAKLKHAQSIDADMVRVDIEELASVLEELKQLKNERKEKSQVIDEFVNIAKSIKFTYPHGNAPSEENEKQLLEYLKEQVVKVNEFIAEQMKKEV